MESACVLDGIHVLPIAPLFEIITFFHEYNFCDFPGSFFLEIGENMQNSAYSVQSKPDVAAGFLILSFSDFSYYFYYYFGGFSASK